MTSPGRKSAASLAIVTPADTREPARLKLPPPAHLGDAERLIWARVFEEHIVRTTAAASILQSGLEAHQRARMAREAIDREGMTCTGRDGQLKPHPLLAVERDARATFLQAFKVLDLEL